MVSKAMISTDHLLKLAVDKITSRNSEDYTTEQAEFGLNTGDYSNLGKSAFVYP